MTSFCPRLSLRDRSRPVTLRLFTSFLCLTLFLAPLLSNSTVVIQFCEEQGCTTPPVVEEEEVCHAIPPRHGAIGPHPGPFSQKAILPTWEEQVQRLQHGEVPHPPPWS